MRYFLLKIINVLWSIKTKLFRPNAFKNNKIEIDENILGHVRLNIKGKNNTIILTNMHINPWTVIIINVCGDNNKININNVYVGEKLLILQGQDHPYFGEIYGSALKIGEYTSIENMRYITYNSRAYCNIGENCMISTEVTLFNTDAHPILDKSTGELINKVKGISIGKHCWLGEKSTILKNTVVPDNSIIGYNAVVSGTLAHEYAAYAGNPAKCVKQGITWDSNGKKYGYIEN